MTHHGERLPVGDGAEIAWSRQGSGAPVVLVHGITENARSFDPLAEQLAATNEVVTLDLRGHGESGTAATYDLAARAGDGSAVATAAGCEAPTYVGHSLGGAVVTAVGAAAPSQAVVCIDQSLQLDAFKAQLMAVEPMLRDADAFGPTIDALFDAMYGSLGDGERTRVAALRRADQNVVLGVWGQILTDSEAEIAATVDAALAGYSGRDVTYVATFGSDPGPYGEWISERIANARVEVTDGVGHYPHLVDPDGYAALIRSLAS